MLRLFLCPPVSRIPLGAIAISWAGLLVLNVKLFLSTDLKIGFSMSGQSDCGLGPQHVFRKSLHLVPCTLLLVPCSLCLVPSTYSSYPYSPSNLSVGPLPLVAGE